MVNSTAGRTERLGAEEQREAGEGQRNKVARIVVFVLDERWQYYRAICADATTHTSDGDSRAQQTTPQHTHLLTTDRDQDTVVAVSDTCNTRLSLQTFTWCSFWIFGVPATGRSPLQDETPFRARFTPECVVSNSRACSVQNTQQRIHLVTESPA